MLVSKFKLFQARPFLFAFLALLLTIDRPLTTGEKLLAPPPRQSTLFYAIVFAGFVLASALAVNTGKAHVVITC